MSVKCPKCKKEMLKFEMSKDPNVTSFACLTCNEVKTYENGVLLDDDSDTLQKVLQSILNQNPTIAQYFKQTTKSRFMLNIRDVVKKYKDSSDETDESEVAMTIIFEVIKYFKYIGEFDLSDIIVKALEEVAVSRLPDDCKTCEFKKECDGIRKNIENLNNKIFEKETCKKQEQEQEQEQEQDKKGEEN